jgi:glycosyltransferase involved in cell wall biosynthesis
MRVAWLGLAPTTDSGTSYIATQLLVELTKLGVEIDCYAAVDRGEIHQRLDGVDGLRLVCLPSGWRHDRWYSRAPLANHLTLQAARVRTQATLARMIVDEHARSPYDVIYHYSQIELFALRRHLRKLPPIIVHPGAHAFGELKWHRRERAIARQRESAARHLAVRAMLRFRATVQSRDARRVARILVPSELFADELARDYRVPRERVHAVPNPIDLERFTPSPPPEPDGPATLVFISRMSVRKGVEMVVDLAGRLSDLTGQVRIVAGGPHDQWSDYRHLLEDLDPAIAEYRGPLAVDEVRSLIRRATCLLQPSHYEPFALTVGESLASGVPVVASDAVGAAEGLGPPCCEVFPAGGADQFEAAVRRTIERMGRGERAAIAKEARAIAEARWDPALIAARVAGHLEAVAAGR